MQKISNTVLLFALVALAAQVTALPKSSAPMMRFRRAGLQTSAKFMKSWLPEGYKPSAPSDVVPSDCGPNGFGLPLVTIAKGTKFRNAAAATKSELDGGRQLFMRLIGKESGTGMTDPWGTYCVGGQDKKGNQIKKHAFVYELKKDITVLAYPEKMADILKFHGVTLQDGGKCYKNDAVVEDAVKEAMTTIAKKSADIVLKAEGWYSKIKAKYATITKANQNYLKSNAIPYAINLVCGVGTSPVGFLNTDELIMWGRSFNSKKYKKLDWKDSLDIIGDAPCSERTKLNDKIKYA